jgi:hypothetical protein
VNQNALVEECLVEPPTDADEAHKTLFVHMLGHQPDLICVRRNHYRGSFSSTNGYEIAQGVNPDLVCQRRDILSNHLLNASFSAGDAVRIAELPQ